MTLHFNLPVEPTELKVLNILKKRMTLPRDALKFYYALEKGYEGEMKFHRLLKEHLASDCIVLYDLLLDSNSSEFQIDCIIIQQRTVWHLEVKNFEGDYILKDNAFYNLATDKEINNPLHQIERGKRLMSELLEKHGYEFPIKSYAIFVNPEFSLYQLPPKLPIVLPGQNRRFIHRIHNTRSKLSSAHHKLAHKLFSLQTSRSLSDRLPDYEFDSLGKGVQCLRCSGFLSVSGFHGRKLECAACGFSESRASAVLRSIVEFSILFPERRITTDVICKWCGGVFSKYKIRNILFQYLRPAGSQTNKYFVFPH